VLLVNLSRGSESFSRLLSLYHKPYGAALSCQDPGLSFRVAVGLNREAEMLGSHRSAPRSRPACILL
jgi:hypothetical protein